MQSPNKETISNSFLRGSIESFELEKSSIQVNCLPIRERKLSPWESKMQNSKMFKSNRKNTQKIEKTEKSEEFLKKIFPKHSRSPENKPSKNFQQLISPSLKKSQTTDKKVTEDDNFCSSFVYLPIKPIRIQTHQNQPSNNHKQELTLTSFRQKMMRSTCYGKTVPPKEIQMTFSSTTYRSTSTTEGKMRNTGNIYFRRKMKKKSDSKQQDLESYPCRKGTLNDMYNLLGIKKQKEKYAKFVSEEETYNEYLVSKSFQNKSMNRKEPEDVSWCISKKTKRNKTKKSSIVCKTVYI